ncbi:MAG: M23 family metallopeptidase [Acidimicrobiia bacterium]
MQWPVLGGGAILSTFGADRDGGSRHHAGVDISAPKMTPVVAVRDGTVSGVHDSPGDCCWVTVMHDDGWSSAYLHLNNDVVGSNNGRGVGIREDLITGLRVTAGEVIGWVGDSGNAEGGIPHLHFELRRAGTPIDPLASLRWAFRRMPPPALAGGPTSFLGPYIDDDGITPEPIFALLTSLGAVTACDPWSARVCPHLEATELEAANWIGALSRVLVPIDTPESPQEILGRIIEQYLACPPEGCPPPTVTVGQVAAMLIWAADQRAHDDALALLDEGAAPETVLIPAAPAPYWSTDWSLAYAILVARGQADDCVVNARSPDQVLSRAGLAEMVGKALGYLPVVRCGAVT